MSPHTIQPVIELAELLYGLFVSRFKREMSQPVITVQTKGRKNACAWFWADRWQDGEPRRIPEINLCAEHVSDGLMELANSVLHEMVHYANWLDGVRDCSASQYHNRRFKDRCESVGLICEQHPQKRYGWACTHLSAELQAFVTSLGVDESRLDLSRVTSGGLRRPGSKLKKWACGCTNLWAAVEVAATCTRCGAPFRRP
jgi:hypothetical protein